MALGSALRRGAKEERDLPFGTVTFLLTDVEASTASWDADADATDAQLRSLDEALRLCVSRNDGRLIKSRGEGDSGFAVFHRASDAVLAAVDLQRHLGDNALRVRAAVHTGEARLRDGDYYGLTPNRAARLRNLAHGGQIVVSRVSADLAEAELPDDVYARPTRDVPRPRLAAQRQRVRCAGARGAVRTSRRCGCSATRRKRS